MLCNFAAVNISCTEFDISISPTQCSILLLSHPTIEPGRSPKNEEDKWIRQFNKNRTGKVCKVLLCWLNVHIEYIDSCDYIKYEIHKYSLQCQVHCEFRRESRISLSSSLSFSLRPSLSHPTDHHAPMIIMLYCCCWQRGILGSEGEIENGWMTRPNVFLSESGARM